MGGAVQRADVASESQEDVQEAAAGRRQGDVPLARRAHSAHRCGLAPVRAARHQPDAVEAGQVPRAVELRGRQPVGVRQQPFAAPQRL